MAGRRAGGAASTGGDRPILVAAAVGKSIDGNVLLRPVDLSVAPGRCVVLRGANGSGKTTLLRILAGTMEPTEGTATVDGSAADERDPAIRRAVAALIGAPSAYRDLTLVDHLVLIEATWGRGDGAEGRAETLLDSLEIGHLAERFPHELSSGQQQLFHLAMVLCRPARVMLLDEPSSASTPTSASCSGICWWPESTPGRRSWSPATTRISPPGSLIGSSRWSRHEPRCRAAAGGPRGPGRRGPAA